MRPNLKIDLVPTRAMIRRVRTQAPGADAMGAIGATATNKIRQCFNRGADPWGRRWRPLQNPSKRRTGRGGKTPLPLLDTGQLRRSILYQNTDSGKSVTVGSAMKYAAIHQNGDQRKKIPARPFLPARGQKLDLPPGWVSALIAAADRTAKAAVKPK